MINTVEYLERFYKYFASRKDLTKLTEPEDTDKYMYCSFQPKSITNNFDSEFFWEPGMRGVANGIIEYDEGMYHTLKIFIVDGSDSEGKIICLTASRGVGPTEIKWKKS